LSHAICRLCGTERDFANYPEECEDIAWRKEEDMGLTADERTKRHQFYEDHKTEIIALYEKEKNAKKTAEILSERWKFEVPPTTIYGLLIKWKVPRKKGRGAKSKPKGRRQKPMKEKVKAEKPRPREEAAGKAAEPTGVIYQGNLVALEKVENGFVMTVFVPTGDTWASIAANMIEAPLRLEISQ
jgi:hypothetical protein